MRLRQDCQEGSEYQQVVELPSPSMFKPRCGCVYSSARPRMDFPIAQQNCAKGNYLEIKVSALVAFLIDKTS